MKILVGEMYGVLIWAEDKSIKKPKGKKYDSFYSRVVETFRPQLESDHLVPFYYFDKNGYPRK